MWRGLLLVAFMLAAGCAQLPLTPQDIQARKFEAVPGKAVVYLVRDSPDFSDIAATIQLGDDISVITYPGTYFRWEVPPGTRRIAGYASDSGMITLQVEAGKVYFVQQRLAPFARTALSRFEPINEAAARAVVARSVLVERRP